MQPAGGDETHSGTVVVQDVNDDAKIEPIKSNTSPNALGHYSWNSLTQAAPNNQGSGMPQQHLLIKTNASCELARERIFEGHSGATEAASSLAAFILNYETVHSHTFSRLTEAMQELFEKKRIR